MRQGVTYGVMAGALWGAVFIAPQLLPDFSPIALSAGRYTAYGLISLLVAAPMLRQLIRKVTRQDCIALIGLALTGNLVYYVLLSAAIQRIGIAPASLIVGVLPITVTLAGQRDHGAVSIRKLVWPLALVVGGIVCINLDVFSTTATSVTTSWIERVMGLLCATGALLSWTWFAVVNTRYLKKHLRYNSHEWSVLSGIMTGLLGVLLGVAVMVMPSPLHQEPVARWQIFWLVNLVLAVSASWLGNALWNSASKRLPLTLSGQLIVFETLFALLYGFVYDSRLPRPLEIAAIVLLMFGVIWSVQLHASARSQRKEWGTEGEMPAH